MILEVQKIKKYYARGDQKVEALGGISLHLTRGQFVSIMGPSGSGKSTLLHLIGGLDRPSSGSIVLDGQPIENYSDAQLSSFRRRKLGFIFYLTGNQNLGIPNRIGPRVVILAQCCHFLLVTILDIIWSIICGLLFPGGAFHTYIES